MRLIFLLFLYYINVNSFRNKFNRFFSHYNDYCQRILSNKLNYIANNNDIKSLNNYNLTTSLITNDVMPRTYSFRSINYKSNTIRQLAIFSSIFLSNYLFTEISNAIEIDNAGIYMNNRSILTSDEIDIYVPKVNIQESLGIALNEVKYKDKMLLLVKSIKSNAPIEISTNIRPGMILCVIGNRNVEGLVSKQVAAIVKQSINNNDSNNDNLRLIFRDPNIFLKYLNTSNYLSNNIIDIPNVITTRIPNLPRDNSILVVERTAVPNNITNLPIKSASFGDILEIEITPIVPFIKSIIDEITKPLLLFIILGSKQISPSVSAIASSFKDKDPLLLPLLSTPGWDIPLRGMIISETRKITYPLGFVSDINFSKEKFSYFITLRSINGEL